ncbi:MAG: hypothetical protein HY362_02920 [Candidatus Aenigmarchaeota archaeon]|nr:hypothetical protein [Candidatus Aenigmarchaeota archaeon]
MATPSAGLGMKGSSNIVGAVGAAVGMALTALGGAVVEHHKDTGSYNIFEPVAKEPKPTPSKENKSLDHSGELLFGFSPDGALHVPDEDGFAHAALNGTPNEKLLEGGDVGQIILDPAKGRVNITIEKDSDTYTVRVPYDVALKALQNIEDTAAKHAGGKARSVKLVPDNFLKTPTGSAAEAAYLMHADGKKLAGGSDARYTINVSYEFMDSAGKPLLKPRARATITIDGSTPRTPITQEVSPGSSGWAGGDVINLLDGADNGVLDKEAHGWIDTLLDSLFNNSMLETLGVQHDNGFREGNETARNAIVGLLGIEPQYMNGSAHLNVTDTLKELAFLRNLNNTLNNASATRESFTDGVPPVVDALFRYLGFGNDTIQKLLSANGLPSGANQTPAGLDNLVTKMNYRIGELQGNLSKLERTDTLNYRQLMQAYGQNGSLLSTLLKGSMEARYFSDGKNGSAKVRGADVYFRPNGSSELVVHATDGDKIINVSAEQALDISLESAMLKGSTRELAFERGNEELGYSTDLIDASLGNLNASLPELQDYFLGTFSPNNSLLSHLPSIGVDNLANVTNVTVYDTPNSVKKSGMGGFAVVRYDNNNVGVFGIAKTDMTAFLGALGEALG